MIGAGGAGLAANLEVDTEAAAKEGIGLTENTEVEVVGTGAGRGIDIEAAEVEGTGAEGTIEVEGYS